MSSTVVEMPACKYARLSKELREAQTDFYRSKGRSLEAQERITEARNGLQEIETNRQLKEPASSKYNDR